jgi:hypothetical protein
MRYDTREPGSVSAYPMLRALRRGFRELGYVLSRGDEAGRADSW